MTSLFTSLSPRAVVSLCFALLGLHVGVQAVQLSDVVVRLRLSPGELGLSVTVSVLSGVLTLLGGGPLIDRLGRRPVLVAGFAGAGLAFLAASQVPGFGWFLAVKALHGFFISLVDLGVNAVGSDYERATGTQAMTGFHSWFSLGAAAGAGLCAPGLAAGLGFRPSFAALGVVLLGLGAWLLRLPLPVSPRTTTAVTSADATPTPGAAAGRRSTALLSGPVLLATALVFLCFFGDGILETFLSTLVRLEQDDAVLAGVVVAAFHACSWLGRTVFQRVLNRVGERLVLSCCGFAAAAATVGGLLLSSGGVPWGTTACFAAVGFFLSPVVPLGFSRAGRAVEPANAGRAIGLVTMVGYTAFIASPLAAGAVADRFGMAVGVGLAAVTMVLMGGVGAVRVRAPESRVTDPSPSR